MNTYVNSIWNKQLFKKGRKTKHWRNGVIAFLQGIDRPSPESACLCFSLQERTCESMFLSLTSVTAKRIFFLSELQQPQKDTRERIKVKYEQT